MLAAPGSLVSRSAVTARLWRQAQRAPQVRLEGARALIDLARTTELGELSHLQSRVAAGVDAAERGEIQRYIQGESVIAAAAAHTYPDARELTALDVDPGCVAAAAITDSP